MLDKWVIVCSNTSPHQKKEIYDKLQRFLKKDAQNIQREKVAITESVYDLTKQDSGTSNNDYNEHGILLQASYLIPRMQVLNVLWILDSVTNYFLQPMNSYFLDGPSAISVANA